MSEIINPKCGGCGGPHPFDTSVPSVLWNRVIRGRGLNDFLCATCILKAFAEAREGFTATLSGEGVQGLSIEVVINGEAAETRRLLEDENNRLRCRLRELDPYAVDEFCHPPESVGRASQRNPAEAQSWGDGGHFEPGPGRFSK